MAAASLRIAPKYFICTSAISGSKPDPITKSIASPELLATITIAKYDYALPLNRQERIFANSGIELSPIPSDLLEDSTY
jgi:transposase